MECQHGPECKEGAACQVGRRVQDVGFLAGNIFAVWERIEHATKRTSKAVKVARCVVSSRRASCALEGAEETIVGLHVPSDSVDVICDAITQEPISACTGAWPYNRPCAQQYVGKYQSCMVTSGRLFRHAPVCMHVRMYNVV